MGRTQSRSLGRLLMGDPPEPDLDWQGMIELARRHEVSPLLSWQLVFGIVEGQGKGRGESVQESPSSPEADPIPTWVRETLRADFYTAAARGIVQDKQLSDILAALDAANVPVVLLKGAAWVRSIYPDPALRTMGDLDLWIPRAHIEKAKEALSALGYAAQSKENRPLALQEAFLGETQMINREPGTWLLELHWNVFPGEWLHHTAQIDEAAVWRRCVPIDGINARQLAPEDAVLNVCLHFAINHQLIGIGIRPLLDLEFMHRTWRIDWGLAVQRAKAWRVSTATWLILDLWKAFFGNEGCQIPWGELQPSRLRKWILRQFVSAESLFAGKVLRKGLERRAFLLSLVDRPTDAVRLVWHTFFPEQQWLKLLYDLDGAPGWRIRLQQVWHPLRVLIHRDV
jgi:hypothetical protein